MTNDATPNPWQVLSAVGQRINQGFGLRSESPQSPRFESSFSLEEASRRTVEEQLAGADIKPIAGWLRHSEDSELAKIEHGQVVIRSSTPS
jgi:hypothetical protein